LTRKEKEKEVAWLREEFLEVRTMILTNYQGLTVAETNALREDLRKIGVKYKVLKNTLARRAYPDTNVARLADAIVGPRGAAWTADEDKSPVLAKTLIDFAKAHPKLELVRGVVGGTLVDPDQIDQLAKLPGKAELRGRLLGTMIAPVSSFVNVLAAVPRSFLNVLKAIEDKKSSPAEEPAA